MDYSVGKHYLCLYVFSIVYVKDTAMFINVFDVFYRISFWDEYGNNFSSDPFLSLYNVVITV